MMEDEDSLFGRATREEDEPIYTNYATGNCENCNNKDLEVQKLKRQEKEDERQENRYFNAVRIFIGCLIFLGIVYGVDVIASGVLKGELSTITDGVVEIIKTLLFSLSGYLFARKESK